MGLAQSHESDQGDVRVDELTNQIAILVSDQAAVHVGAVIENMDHEYAQAQGLQSLQVLPVHSHQRRKNPDAMAFGEGVLHHFGTVRIEPRFGVSRKTNVDGSRYAG
ncbi:hypothetical protein [Mesorhizobium sp.]|uniref:hypothetical protein n=1 Tax=Mesorhizobium sp. TaxID=1871066 RepID=UPI0025C04A03|nr:hypothetical protein [Mesorhizobium sp.]